MRSRLLAGLYALTLTACGYDDPRTPGAAGPDAASERGREVVVSDAGGGEAQHVAFAPDAPRDAGGGEGALYVYQIVELPRCSQDTYRELVYVAETARFYHCDASGWEEIDLRGKDGRDGRDGTNGTDGTKVNNTWHDPVTGRTWLIGSLAMAYQVYSTTGPNYGRAAGWSLPDNSMADEAWRDGLGTAMAALQAGTAIWLFGSSAVAYNAPASQYTQPTFRAVMVCYQTAAGVVGK